MPGVRLKWPNDLVTAGGKLGGILIEMRAESGGPVHVVVGIGLNVLLDDAARAAVKATGNVADDIRAHRTPVPDRNAIVAALLARLVPALEGFPAPRPHAASRQLARLRCAARARSARRKRRRNHARRRARHRRARRAAGRDAHGRATLHLRRSHGANRSMTTLLVDIGNTRVKWATLRGAQAGTHAGGARMRTPGWRCARWCAAHRRDVSRVVVVSVVGRSAVARARRRRAPALRHRARIHPFDAARARRDQRLSRHLAARRRSLGVGRRRARAGAGRTAVIANVGTALTIDAVIGRRPPSRRRDRSRARQPWSRACSTGTHGIRRRASGGGVDVALAVRHRYRERAGRGLRCSPPRRSSIAPCSRRSAS